MFSEVPHVREVAVFQDSSALDYRHGVLGRVEWSKGRERRPNDLRVFQVRSLGLGSETKGVRLTAYDATRTRRR